ncbi:hypothetical protein E2562_009614 [Oryza meyeriana var. granulata]|uniref:Uncharacterized protein n=1 Tax=Oryza meyeriana var. granulata TaxID=110450 RepID=A0A6G1BJR5_9ORYZ|nr:hypothetical protein E2562_009614 [Oryza meyeriana var. granulata]
MATTISLFARGQRASDAPSILILLAHRWTTEQSAPLPPVSGVPRQIQPCGARWCQIRPPQAQRHWIQGELTIRRGSSEGSVRMELLLDERKNKTSEDERKKQKAIKSSNFIPYPSAT